MNINVNSIQQIIIISFP